MRDIVPFVLSSLPVVIFALVIAIDLRFGVFLHGITQEKPVYREDQPLRFWLLEGVVIAITVCLAIQPAIELWRLLRP